MFETSVSIEYSSRDNIYFHSFRLWVNLFPKNTFSTLQTLYRDAELTMMLETTNSTLPYVSLISKSYGKQATESWDKGDVVKKTKIKPDKKSPTKDKKVSKEK